MLYMWTIMLRLHAAARVDAAAPARRWLHPRLHGRTGVFLTSIAAALRFFLHSSSFLHDHDRYHDIYRSRDQFENTNINMHMYMCTCICGIFYIRTVYAYVHVFDQRAVAQHSADLHWLSSRAGARMVCRY